MEFGGASSLVLLLAVGLWIAYVIPSLVRRQNYLATERNAVRLQQALRALAETAQAPSELHVETSARGVAEQRRRVKRAERAAREAQRERIAVAERTLPAVPLPRNDDDRRRAAAATRRGRLMTTFVLVAGLAAAGVGGWLGATTGMWWVLVGGVVAVLFAFAMLQRLGRVAAAQRLAAERQADVARDRRDGGASTALTAPQPRLVQPVADLRVAGAGEAVEASPAVAGWTPIAVPRPLYLMRDTASEGLDGGPGSPGGPGGPSGPDGGRPASTVDIEALREAARRSEQAIRDAHAQPGVITFGRVASVSLDATGEASQPVAASYPSRWDAMGRVDVTADGAEAPTLRRRRAG